MEDWTGFKDYPHLEMTGGLYYSQKNAGKKPSLSLKFKIENVTVITVPPKTEVASKVSKEPSKNKWDNTIFSIQKTLNSRYKAGLVVDGRWGAKTKAAIVTVQKGAKGNLTWILQSALYLEGFNPGSFDSIFGKGTESALSKFQKAKKITADKKAGKATFTKLLAA